MLLAASCMVVGTVPGAAGGWSESKPLEIFLERERDFCIEERWCVFLVVGCFSGGAFPLEKAAEIFLGSFGQRASWRGFFILLRLSF